MSFFVSVVFGDIVKVIFADDDGSLHFGGNDDSLQDFASDGHTAGEGAFLIDVVALDGFLGGSEVETNIFVVPHTGGSLLGEEFLAVQENVVLLLEGSFVLS